MTEFEKMRNQQLFDFSDPEVLQSQERAFKLCARLRPMTIYDEGYRELIEELIPGIPESTSVVPPFFCSHGNGITIGENTYVNIGTVILDDGPVTIGSHVKIGPRCQIVTNCHPIDYLERRKPTERELPVVIGDDCWIGTGVIIRPGVTIGDRCVIGAGSVVVHDIPSDSMAVGNPAKVIRKLSSK